MKRRLVSFFLVVAMMVLFMPTTALAATEGDYKYHGSTITGYTGSPTITLETDDGGYTDTSDDSGGYILTDDDVVIVDGELKHYIPTEHATSDIIIPNFLDGQTVTKIGECAFVDEELTSVIFPQSLTHIGASSFLDNKLASVSIPDGVKYVGDTAFKINNLTSISIPSSVTSMGHGAFNNNDIVTINGEASNGIIFARNSDGSEDTSIIVSYGGAVKDVDFIPNSVTCIDDSAFYKCGLDSVIIPNSVTKLGRASFTGNNLTSIDIPSSITNIPDLAFYLNSLQSIDIKI